MKKKDINHTGTVPVWYQTFLLSLHSASMRSAETYIIRYNGTMCIYESMK